VLNGAVRAPPTSGFVSRFVRFSVSACLLQACALFQPGNPSQRNATGTSNGAPTRVQRREFSRHPPINLLVRLGDPLSAVAFASAHDSGSVASVALSALLLARLHAHGIEDVLSTPTAGGLSLAVLCADAASARAFSEQVTAALAVPVAEGDPALPAIQAALAALRARRFAGQAEATVASCSEALGLLWGTPLPDLGSAAGRAELDAYRRV
jgi:hypothetical protein